MALCILLLVNILFSKGESWHPTMVKGYILEVEKKKKKKKESWLYLVTSSHVIFMLIQNEINHDLTWQFKPFIL